MNFFFGISNNEFDSTLTIPKFQNNAKHGNDYKTYAASIINEKWKIEKLNCLEDDDFFFVDKNFINNETFFFLSKEDNLRREKTNLTEIIYPDKFTDTDPEYRASLEIFLKGGGFSSYQSEYPYRMIDKKSKLLTPLSSLLHRGNEKNFLIFRNIYFEPEHKNFNLYLINLDKMEVFKKIEVFTNKTNIIHIENEFIQEKNYILSDTFLGIPIFLSVNNGHLSLEHTHPPYHYILGKENFELSNKWKNKIYEKIFTKNISI